MTLQNMGQLLIPFLLFLCVRSLVSYLVQVAFLSVGKSVSGWDFFFLRDEVGALTGFTGNVWALASAISCIAAILSVWGTVRLALSNTADDMRLEHLKREPGKSYVILGVLTVCAVFGLNMLLELAGAAQTSGNYQAVQAEQFSAGLLLSLVCYGLISPIAEELIFRGVVYGKLRRMTGRILAMAFSALLFGMYHMNLVQGIYGTVMGCLMVYAYEYFGSFWAAAAIHVAANVLALGMGHAGSAMSGMTSWPACLVFLGAAAGGVFWLHRRKGGTMI